MVSGKKSMLISVSAMFVLPGCASLTAEDGFFLSQPETHDTVDDSQSQTSSNFSDVFETDGLQIDEQRVDRRRVPVLPRSSHAPVSEALPPGLEGAEINVTLPPQSIPNFINTVFGDILQRPFALGDGVAERTEVITLRSVQQLAPDTFLALVEEALKDYGLAVTYENGLFRVVSLDVLRAQMPQFIRSRSGAQVPTNLRPVVQFIELAAIDAADMQQILEQAFPDRTRLNIRNNRAANSLVISGLSEDVNAALQIVNQMDQLRFAGTQVISVSPRHWDADQLARDMSNILAVEGYQVGIGANFPRAITLLPIEHVNDLLIFARNENLAARAVQLATNLDNQAFVAEAEIPHVYSVQNMDALDLAQVVSSATGDNSSPQQTNTAQDGASTALDDERSSSASSQFGEITVDTLGNRIIFFGTSEEYQQIERLLMVLDTPAPEVQIEVTIAEVTLTDGLNYGLNAVFNTETASQFSANLSSNGGIQGVVNTGQVQLTANASATANQINVLSTPRIVTRSGTAASIQVGTDVPIITTQRAAETQLGGATDVLQSVEYRSTGVILNVEPKVYSGNRIDLVISQEVSSAEANENSAIASPVISNRSMTSELTLQDGQTAVLGGLIENRYTRGNNGVPLVKDVPVLGNFFRSETMSATRTMLVVLVTPYILSSRADRQRQVDNLTGLMNQEYRNQLSPNRTLTSPRTPMQIRLAPGLDDIEVPASE